MPDLLTTEEVTALVKRAYDTILDLNHNRKRWEMSIPARHDVDPDLIISDALRAQESTIRDLEREGEGGTE
jgi:hypothetical protein